MEHNRFSVSVGYTHRAFSRERSGERRVILPRNLDKQDVSQEIKIMHE